MAERLLRVNAYTTFDLVDATVRTHDGSTDVYAVLNVTADRENPEHVELQLEVDNVDLDSVPAHAETVRLSAEEARTLASALESHANRVEE